MFCWFIHLQKNLVIISTIKWFALGFCFGALIISTYYILHLPLLFLTNLLWFLCSVLRITNIAAIDQVFFQLISPDILVDLVLHIHGHSWNFKVYYPYFALLWATNERVFQFVLHFSLCGWDEVWLNLCSIYRCFVLVVVFVIIVWWIRVAKGSQL